MSGALAMGNNKITGLAPATANGDAVDFEFFNNYVPYDQGLETIIITLIVIIKY